MKLLTVLFFISTFTSVSYLQAGNKNDVKVKYQVNVLNHKDDLFHVSLEVSKLTSKNNIYNFAATAPGTYDVMNFGRFVKSFKAFNKSGNVIPTENISVNRWKISNPEKVTKIEYDIEDSFDADIKEDFVAPMSGTGIEENYIVLNNFGVLGYFEGLQSAPIKVKLEYDPEWIVGTALRKDKDGYYPAESYDHLADSPFLIGNLTKSVVKISGIDVEVYVYASDTTSLSAYKILNTTEKVLKSSSGFIGYAPVKNYAFLMCFMDMDTFSRNKFQGAGALEHCTSSLYTMPAGKEFLGEVQGTVAHEFLHILTPLHLHSEIIHKYNFAVPTASEHIWLYEGVTEWASNIMQLRGNLMTPKEFMQDIETKLRTNDQFDKDYSLSAMSLESYQPKGSRAFINFYNKGAVTAALLDIRLLELSKGKKGLREVFLSLLKKYGKNKPFPEKDFFKILVKETYPEIENFINDYIRGSKELPLKEYFEKVGFSYLSERISADKNPTFGAGITMIDGNIVAINVSKEAQDFGLRNNDIILKVFDIEMNQQNAQQIMMKRSTMKAGDPFQLVIKRGSETLTLDGKLLQRKDKHIFDEIADLTDSQKTLKAVWTKNL